MAITVTEVQVLWGTGSAADQSLSASGTAESLAFVINQTCFQATLEMKADNDATAAANDTVDFYLEATLGDPDGTGANEYDTKEQATHLATLDTNAADPALRTVQIPMPLVGGKIYAVNHSAARAITVSAIILEQRG